jgi:2-polyprenyl-6-methoxyphenol hydroxylase-like FAD-dependent oxidoreductase
MPDEGFASMISGITTAVAIAGAGPVGLILAMDLASRGIDVVVLEQRREREPPSVKCNHVSARTMEILRRLGIADEVRSAGLPDDYPHDVVVRTRATGFEITRIPIPSRNRRFTAAEGPDVDWPTPEPAHRINQIYFEPILFDCAARTPRVKILSRTQVDSHTQSEHSVIVQAHGIDDGKPLQIECQYFIGCDGARSGVRRAMGATLSGDEVIQRVQSSYIRAPSLLAQTPTPRAWMSYLYNHDRAGNLVAIDGRERWLVHNYLLPHEADFESVDRDKCIRLLLGVDADFQYEVLSNEDWIGRRLVANTFRNKRVFLCGDSAHLWVPYAGYGMNAGIADAANLAWLLGAHLNGWAPEAILDAYDMERRRTTEQVSLFVAKHAQAAITERTTLPAEIEEDSPAGRAARARVGRDAYLLHVQQFACAGLNFGYGYDQSPLIVYDEEPITPYTMANYRPSTVPGCRTPHLWLKHGRSLYDLMGNDYALLRFDPGIDISPLVAAAAVFSMPMKVLDIPGEQLPPPYRHKLLLSRPDQHVAWRGDAIPDDARALVDRVRGALRYPAGLP